MSIVERFSKIYPKAKVYWNGNINQLSLHFNENINEQSIRTRVYKELSFCNLLNAVNSIRILSY